MLPTHNHLTMLVWKSCFYCISFKESKTEDSNYGTLKNLTRKGRNIRHLSHTKGLLGPENLCATGVANRLDVELELDTTKDWKIEVNATNLCAI